MCGRPQRDDDHRETQTGPAGDSMGSFWKPIDCLAQDPQREDERGRSPGQQDECRIVANSRADVRHRVDVRKR